MISSNSEPNGQPDPKLEALNSESNHEINKMNVDNNRETPASMPPAKMSTKPETNGPDSDDAGAFSAFKGSKSGLTSKIRAKLGPISHPNASPNPTVPSPNGVTSTPATSSTPDNIVKLQQAYPRVPPAVMMPYENYKTVYEAAMGLADLGASKGSKPEGKGSDAKAGNKRKASSAFETSAMPVQEKSFKYQHRTKRVDWSPELHAKFLQAVVSLGPERSVPKEIMKRMNVPGLSREKIASHLQSLELAKDGSAPGEAVHYRTSRGTQTLPVKIIIPDDFDAAVDPPEAKEGDGIAETLELTKVVPEKKWGKYKNAKYTDEKSPKPGSNNVDDKRAE